ncbi:hypothetical protein ACFY8C_09710 [Streptomyces flavochromogenes]|uniref:Uncharacterized protein n=1 Tax=Streptomyces flavochromogenes TaxID=68199 RepID=A0ABW6XMA7_9ACTN
MDGQKEYPGSGSSYDTLRRLKEEGRIIMPLSATHYLETFHRSDWESRWALSSVMSDLSDFCTVAPIHKLQRAEVARAVSRRLTPRKLHPIPALGVIGFGVDHAFASEYGRFRYVENIETNDRPEGPPVDPGEYRIDRIRHLSSEWEYQWYSLAFLPVGGDDFGLDRITQHRRGRRYAEDEARRSAELHAAGSKEMMSRALITEDFNSLVDDINWICEILNVDPHRLIRKRGDVYSFVFDIPTRHVFHALRSSRYVNPQQGWHQHDFADFMALAVAIPYCDVVVTERHWRHVAIQAGLDKTYDTQIFHKLDDAVAALQILTNR